MLVSLIAIEVDRTRSALDGVDEADRAVLDQLAVAITGVEPSRLSTQASMAHPAVHRWLPDAVAGAPPLQLQLADAIRRAAPVLGWTTAYPTAPPTPEMRRFWEHYAFAPLVSPEGSPLGSAPLSSTVMSLYLVIQGPGVEYGRHHHPAVEVYGVVSGTARWLRGADGYRSRSPGDVFVHHPEMVHATTTGDEPTLSWAAWLGDLRSMPSLEVSDVVRSSGQ